MPMFEVLFPGMPMPLDLWEDRYIEMARECLESDTEFGVVLIDKGKEVGGPVESTYRIGTTARIAFVDERDDHISALAVGQRKFRIERVLQRKPRMHVDARFFAGTEGGGVSSELIEDSRTAFEEYLALMMELIGLPEIEMTLPDDPERLSYMIAAHLQISAVTRQKLLEMDNSGHRLIKCIELMEKTRDDYRLVLTATEDAPEAFPEDGIFSNN